jgi:hypothetical protein
VKLAKFKIFKKTDNIIVIKFLDFNDKSVYNGRGVKVDFNRKRVIHETSWSRSFINKDVFTLTFGCTNYFGIEKQGRNELLRVPIVDIGKEYEFTFDEKYTAEFLIERIVKTFEILSKR